MGKKNLVNFGRVSTHYLINAKLEKGDSDNLFFGENGKKLRKYLYGRSMPYNTLKVDLIFLGQCAMPRGHAFCDQYFLNFVALDLSWNFTTK